MKKFILTLSAVFAAVIFSGCGHTPVRSVFPAALPPEIAAVKESAARAESFKKIIAPAEVRGIGLFPAAFAGEFSNEQIFNAVKVLGFNRIYCQLTSEMELDSRLVDFLTAANAAGLPVELVFNQQDFYRRYRGNRLIRNFFIQYPDLAEVMEETVEFINDELPENVKVAGVTVILAPHLFNGSNFQRIQGHLYCWSEKRYGIGEDNDMLMRESLVLAEKISKIPGLPPLTIAVPDFLHDAASEGKLSCGKVEDFAKLSAKVAVVSSANLPSKIFDTVSDEFSAMPEGKKALAVIRLAGHTSLETGRLRRRNWQDFQRTMAYFMSKSAGVPAFGGIIVTPLAVIEYLRQEK